MYTLYYSPGAASLVVHWMLIELNAPHTLKALDMQAGEQKSPEYLKLNPSGVVPTLLIDGVPVSEAAGLVIHLADAYPNAGFAPKVATVERAKYYQWMFHLANVLQPLFRQWFYAQEVAGQDHADAVKEVSGARIEAVWDRIDAHLAANGPYLLGDNISAADFHLTMLMRWSRNMPKQALNWPHLAALAEKMKARPSFKALYEREQLTEWA